MSNPDRYAAFHAELSRLRESGNERQIPPIHHEGSYIIKNGKRMLNLSSNDYMGLASENHTKTFFEAAGGYGNQLLTSSSSRLLTGDFECMDELEHVLATSYAKESALVFNSGYHANSGILPALTNGNSLIIADKLVHASIIDGIKLCGCKHIRFRHNDYQQLERLIRENKDSYERIFIVTESIFSMDGDCADLKRLAELKQTSDNIFLYVDEAHAVGVRGRRGLGLAEESGSLADIDLLVGTFGKACASMGAFVVCDGILRDMLVNKARTLIFTTALPPINARWTLHTWEILQGRENERKAFARKYTWFADRLRGKGYSINTSSNIIPIIIGQNEATSFKAKMLQEAGYYALPVRPPTVPENTERLRLSLTANMETETLENLLNLL